MTQQEITITTDASGNIQIDSTVAANLNISEEISGIALIGNGDEAKSKPLNDNFMYLNTKIGTAKDQMVAEVDEVVSNINTTIANQLATYPTVNIITSESSNVTYDSTNSRYVITLTDNTINRVDSFGNTTFTLPTISSAANGQLHQILVQINKTNYSHAITTGVSNYFYKIIPDFTLTGKYDIVYEYDGAAWVAGAMKKGSVS